MELPRRSGFRWHLATVLAFLFTLLFLPVNVLAEEAGDVEVVDGAEDAAGQAGSSDEASSDEAAQEGSDGEGQTPMSFEDSAKEVQARLSQLKDLLKARGKDVDPELMEKLGGLESQLQGLGATLGLASNPEAHDLYASCMSMSVMRAGATRKSTRQTLRQMASGDLGQPEAAKVDLLKMVATCINDLTVEELQQYKAKSIGLLPKALAEKATSAEASTQVEELGADVWLQLKAIASELAKELEENASNTPVGSGWQVAVIPATLAVFFMMKGFRAMMKRKDEAKKKKEKKEAKKQK
mmetsp:Transcript_76421/g.181783  ORF Transcript_76421/g.181783 Transcript_76421/m.181783 type:complete len:297 (-) Transcript_76421:46-936(-)|eukprot:CAMPEP_0178451068 /NCGR_PEP_ID=MMETSP0689_2-20121128/43475_1 /TAXON_ID=160604 /ORGANISM="Amphidinium massartii, Strain CS-259" /LENGTH=296 /DNA_ID=CAMNT_0020076605 /DNA_START=21 /DNA_END=911 /DNA_ORIENTATION=-